MGHDFGFPVVILCVDFWIAYLYITAWVLHNNNDFLSPYSSIPSQREICIVDCSVGNASWLHSSYVRVWVCQQKCFANPAILKVRPRTNLVGGYDHKAYTCIIDVVFRSKVRGQRSDYTKFVHSPCMLMTSSEKVMAIHDI